MEIHKLLQSEHIKMEAEFDMTQSESTLPVSLNREIKQEEVGCIERSLQDTNKQGEAPELFMGQKSLVSDRVIGVQPQARDVDNKYLMSIESLNSLSHTPPEVNVTRKHLMTTVCLRSGESTKDSRRVKSRLTDSDTPLHSADWGDSLGACKPDLSSVLPSQEEKCASEPRVVLPVSEVPNLLHDVNVKVEGSNDIEAEAKHKPVVCDIYNDDSGRRKKEELTIYKYNTVSKVSAYNCDEREHTNIYNGEKHDATEVFSRQCSDSISINENTGQHTGSNSFEYIDENIIQKKRRKTHNLQKDGSFSFGRQKQHKRYGMCRAKLYKCVVCGSSFTQMSRLRVHKRTHTVTKLHKCQVCGLSFRTGNTLARHKRTHIEKTCYKGRVYNVLFPESNSVPKHRKTLNAEQEYKCDFCEKSFVKKRYLNRHLRRHPGERIYKCDVCSISFFLRGDLTKHRKTHLGEKPHKCNVCDSAFSHHSSLAKHRKAHTGEKPNKCEVCGSSFSHRSDLAKHMIIHTGEKPYKCEICGASFARKDHLLRHNRTHTGEKPCKCDICGLAFSQSSNLAQHKRVHTGEKPYSCDVCGLSFSHTGNLAKHKSTHTMPSEEKQFKCDVCGTVFANKDYLLRHKRTQWREAFQM